MVSSEAIAAMKSMAMDPKKRVILAKDATCIGGLIIVLSNEDCHIVLQALQTLILLCESHEACRIVKKQLGIMDQLESLVICSGIDEPVKRSAKQLLQKLSEESSQAPLRDTSNLSRNSNNSIGTLKGGSHAKSKSIVLHIRGLHDKSDRELCGRLLLKVNGVISITFDMNKKHCILRTRADVKPEDLASSIAKSMTMIAQQVIRNERGEESLLNFNLSGTSQSSENKEREEDLPDYLSDDSDHSFIDDRAVRKATDQDKKKSAGWFSMAANFLSNSFYW